MRKILLSILIIILLIVAGFVIVDGIDIGNFQIWGVKAIISQNEKIDSDNQNLSNLVSVTYPNSVKELKGSSDTLTTTKKDYEEKSELVSNSKYYMQTEKYEIEYLWTKLGNYAQDNNVQIKIDVVSSSTSGLYDLKFTIAGMYEDVTEFIYDIENDSKLGFKIEEFNMVANGPGVQSTFTCKEININIEQIEIIPNESTDNTTTNNTTNDTTNSTTTDTTQNTTNNEVTQNATSEQATNNTVENQVATENQ